MVDSVMSLFASCCLARPPPHRLECAELRVPVRPEVFEVSAYFEQDSFRGYVVALREEGAVDGALYEVLLERQSHLVVGSLEGDVAQRLLSIDVRHMVVIVTWLSCDGGVTVAGLSCDGGVTVTGCFAGRGHALFSCCVCRWAPNGTRRRVCSEPLVALLVLMMW